MTITTTIGDLELALRCVLKAVDTKQITAEFRDGKLMIHGCANQGHAKAVVPTRGDLPDMVFPITGKLVLTIINNCDSASECTISQHKDGLRLKFGGASIKLTRYTEKEVDFFNWTVSDEETRCVGKFDSHEFKQALSSVVKFISSDSSRFQLRGVYFQSVEGRLVLAATNAYCLAEKITSIVVENFAPMIISGQYVEALVAIIKGNEDVVFSIVGGKECTAVIFNTSNFSVKCPLIGGAYPAYRSVIPMTDHSLTVNAASLLAALTRMKAVSEELFVRLLFKEGAISVLTLDGESSEFMDAEGDDFELSLGVRPELLTVALTSAVTKQVKVSVTLAKGINSFVTVTNTKDDGWLSLITPAPV